MYILDEQVIKDFEAKLNMFQNSLNNISSNFLAKLEELAAKTREVVSNTGFLKRMKKIYDEQNAKLERMEKTINELLNRLEYIKSEGYKTTSKKKKKKKK